MWDEDTEHVRGSLFSTEEGVTLGDLFYRNDPGYLFKMQDPGVHTTNLVSIESIRSQEPEYVYMWGGGGMSWKQTWEPSPYRLNSSAWHSVPFLIWPLSNLSIKLVHVTLEPRGANQREFSEHACCWMPRSICSFAHAVLLPKVNCSPSPCSKQADLFPDSSPL